MPPDPHMILPEPREPWGWQRPQRVMLAILLAVGLCLIGISWAKHPAGLAKEPQVEHQPVPELEALIDPNTATAASISRIPGIGPVLAQRIVDFRERRMAAVSGPVFTRLADLGLVTGIGRKKLEQLRPWMKLPETPAILTDGVRPARKIDPEEVTDSDED